jgi:predicted CoA-binding protein
MPNPPDDELRRLLSEAQVIAVVGHSEKPHRTSYQIASYLRKVGYTVYPVNPVVERIDGHVSYPSLESVPESIDIVNVFRRSEHLAGIVDEVIAVQAGAIWGQLGVIDEEAAQKAEEAGVRMVMDRCIKMEHLRLLSV